MGSDLPRHPRHPRRRGSLSGPRAVLATVLLVSALVGGAFIACGPPPIGWTGAGRIQTLPAPQGEAGAATMPSADTGADDTSGGDDTSEDAEMDAEMDAEADAEMDAEADAEMEAEPEASTPDSAVDAPKFDGG
jgi:hypothetical protein